MVDIQVNETWSNSPKPSLIKLPLIPNELLQSLKQHSLFQRTNNEGFIERLSCCMHIRTYSPRDVIIVEGEQAKAMFFLLKGSLNVCSADFERIYATLQKGSCFGEIGILYSMPRTATVVASTKCIVATVTADDVRAILPQYPKVEKMLRFEAEERLALLRKSSAVESVTQNTITKENVEEASSARKLLQKVPYFKNCPEDFLHHVSLKVEPRQYALNDLIFNLGDEGNELYFIITGTVELTNADSAPIERLSAGDYFGDIAVVLNTCRIANARAITPTHVYVLQKSDFTSALDDFPDLQKYFKIMSETSHKNLKAKAALKSESGSEPNTVITPESVCSTTSDQDPTVPVTKTDVLKTRETRKRRGSVAVWSDPNLVALANRHIKQKPATSKDEPIEAVPISTTQASDKSRLSALTEDILSNIVNQLDFASIINFSSTSKKFHDYIKTCEKILHTLDPSHMNKHITDDALVQIATTYTGSRVKHVNLAQCYYITDDGFKAFIETVPNLESLDLNSCWLLTDKSLSLLATCCPQLTHLDLSNCRKISDIGLFKLLDTKATHGYPELKSLSLSYCKKVSDMTMSYLADFCNQTLESLDIQRCTRISEQGFAKWTETKFSRLKHVNLTDCSFLTDSAISHLVTAAPNINSLSLSFCCALSDGAIEGLMNLNGLKCLDASFCGAAVSDVSIRALLKSMSVESLNLRGCVRITDKSMLDLAQLKSLNISQCPGISTDAKQVIKNSVQNLIV